MNLFSDRSLLFVLALGTLWLLAAGCDTIGGGTDSGPLLPPGVYAVDADATGDATGASWDNAISDFQVALDSAEAGDEIWVATGTYVPSEPRDPGEERTASFVIPAGVEVYGGFSGDETRRRERETDPSRTILSGDRGAENESSDNSFHVVVTEGGDAETKLQNVTIEAGNANGEETPQDHGGGLYNEGGRIALEGVMFRDNEAVEGGGVFSRSGTTTLNDVTFANNRATSFGGGAFIDEKAKVNATNLEVRSNDAFLGGGILNVGQALLSDVTFESNAAIGSPETLGGGLLNYYGELTLQDAQFRSNQAEGSGGGLFLLASLENADARASKVEGSKRAGRPSGRGGGIPTSRAGGAERSTSWAKHFGGTPGTRNGTAPASVVPSIKNVRFEGNEADFGGAVYNQYADAVFQDVTFVGNQADTTGGGVYNRFNDADYRSVTFRDNVADLYGGGIYSNAATGTIVDARFVGNEAGDYGGGADNVDGEVTYANVLLYDNEAGQEGGAFSGLASEYTLRGVTAVQNRASEGGAALYTVIGVPEVVNSIFWQNGNSDTGEVSVPSGRLLFRHSIIRGSGGSGNWNYDYGSDGGGNLDRSPEFTSMAADELRLSGGSPAIDAGTGDEIQRYDTSDLADNPRFVDGDGDGDAIIDMGAYEYQQ